MNTETVNADTVAEFVKYCKMFYDFRNPGALYPMATAHEIETAIEWYLQNPKVDFAGDTIDRENVRNILESWGCREHTIWLDR
jgi:hypothetical protein